MSDDIVKKFITALVVIVVSGFAGWLIKIGFAWVFQNATGQYDTAAQAAVVNNLPLIFVALGLLVVVVILLFSAMHATKNRR